MKRISPTNAKRTMDICQTGVLVFSQFLPQVSTSVVYQKTFQPFALLESTFSGRSGPLARAHHQGLPRIARRGLGLWTPCPSGLTSHNLERHVQSQCLPPGLSPCLGNPADDLASRATYSKPPWPQLRFEKDMSQTAMMAKSFQAEQTL